MSNPFSGIPDPGTPPPIRRRLQPASMQDALRAMRNTLRVAMPKAKGALRRAQWAAKDGLRRAQRYSEDLWRGAKRHPRTAGVMAGAIALTLVGAFALHASGAGRSLCPPASDGKTPPFLLLMDPVSHVKAGSEVEIHYDVCGLASGSPYRGRVRLTPVKKGSAKPKPLVVSFKDQVDGVATRRQQELDLASTKPGTYTLELSVADSKGRERTRVQKVLVKAR
jgi:hypothetical protein